MKHYEIKVSLYNHENKPSDQTREYMLASCRDGNSTSLTCRGHPEEHRGTVQSEDPLVCVPILFAGPRLQVGPAKGWVVTQMRNVAGYHLNPSSP